jgi:hypothetical protein
MDRPLCPLCNTKHFAREPHEFKVKDDGKTKQSQGQKPVPSPTAEVVHPKPEVGGKGPGRPRIYPDAKVRRREYMRDYRASKRVKVLADGTRPPEVKSGSE